MQHHFTLAYWIDEGWYVGKLREKQMLVIELL